jgi:hypothetical protein
MRLKRAGIIGENTLMRTVCGISVAALLLATFPAFAVDSKVIGRSTATPDVVWAKIGDFCGIAAWHPAIEKCTLSGDGKVRTLALKGGGVLHERLEKRDEAAHSYSYSIIDGPLPVANYLSTISVAADGAGSKITWIGKYDAKGASDAEAMKVIDGVYQGGIDVLVK